MAVGGVGGARQAGGLDAGQAPARADGAGAQAEARVTRTPTSARPDPTRVGAKDAAAHAPEGPRPKPSDFLTTKAERDTYGYIVGADRPVAEILDRLDALSPASYNRVLHALVLTRRGEGSILDKLFLRALLEPAQAGEGKVGDRLLPQLRNKLAGQPGSVLAKLHADTRARLAGGRIAGLLE